MPESFSSTEHPSWCAQHLADEGIDLHVSESIRINVPGGQPVEVTLQQDGDSDGDPVLYVYNHATGADQTLGRGEALAQVLVIAAQLAKVNDLLSDSLAEVAP